MSDENQISSNINTELDSLEQKDSIWQAFSYMFKTKGIFIFVIFAAIINFINSVSRAANAHELISYPVIIICLCIALFVQPFFCGYIFSFTKALSTQKNEFTAPKFRFGESFVYGFKYFIAMLILVGIIIIPAILIILIPIIGAITLFIASCFFAFCYPAMNWYFAHTKRLTTFISFKTILELIKRNKSRYLDAIVASIITCVVFGVISILILLPTMNFTIDETSRQVINLNSIIPVVIVATIGIYPTLINIFINAKCIDSKEIENLNK